MAAPSITTLQEIFEVEKLSAEQEKAIDSLLAKKDVFLSLRTGGGKSLCYMAFPIFYEYSNSLDVQPQVLINMFYGVTVGASAEGATHMSSLLNATRGLNQTKKNLALSRKLLPPQGTGRYQTFIPLVPS